MRIIFPVRCTGKVDRLCRQNGTFGLPSKPWYNDAMAIKVNATHVDKLVAIESHIHYAEPPPPGREAFVVVPHPSPVLLSAPHGAITYRHNARQVWHDEDDYTAGLALLLSELCGVSTIATIWRTERSDPNYHRQDKSPYKRALKRLVSEMNVRWVIDLHGAADASLAPTQLVDLGTRKAKRSLPRDQLCRLSALLESKLGRDTVSHNHFAARVDGRTITAYSHGVLGLHAVQIEMKSAVRVPLRRVDATAYALEGPFAARSQDVIGLMQALADFIDRLSDVTDTNHPA
ncbi:MAG: hypothetical protein JXA89_15800 [Anaerolineae bacterium]|nr:hypothetical protein [Anaerolineae bacterium]